MSLRTADDSEALPRAHARVRSRALLAIGVVAVVAVAGGVVYQRTRSESGCLPAYPLVVTADPGSHTTRGEADGHYLLAYPGSILTVSAPGVACDTRYGKRKTYTVYLLGGGQSGSRDPLTAVNVPVGADGAFSATLTVPATAALGGATIFVSGSNFDGGCGGGDCVSYSESLVIGTK